MREVILHLLLQVIIIPISSGVSVVKISYSELSSIVKSGDTSTLADVFSMSGVLAVTNMPEEYIQAIRTLKTDTPHCMEKLKSPQFFLPDGSQRRTFASSSDNPEEYPECIRDASEVISKHFDKVDALVSNIVTSLAGRDNTEWITEKGMRGNFTNSLYKEHIHVYKPLEGESLGTGYAAPFHTDNGLLLMITPFQEHPLLAKDKDEKLIETDTLGDDSLLILTASGLPHWLLKGTESSSKFHSTRHAVPSLVNTVASRTIFARMKVAPMDASPSNRGHHKLLFKDFFNNVEKSSDEVCPIAKPAYQLALEKDWKTLKKTECKHSEAFCWMNCLELPSSSTCDVSEVQCRNKDDLPCCTDTITEHCENMDPSCKWECKGSGHSNHSTEEKFCNGQGTDMYMQGFTASGDSKDACVILLFKSWVLDTRTKFAFGCIGVILLGIAIEGLLCLRREIQSRKILLRIRGLTRRASIIFLFALNIGSGYLAMLVAMTYSVELFICMVLGLVIGHGIFNTDASVGESVDPCCASQAIGPNDAKEKEAEITIKKKGCCHEKQPILRPSESVCSANCFENKNFMIEGNLGAVDCRCDTFKKACDCV